MGGRTQMPDDKMRDHNLNQQAGQKDDKGQGQQSPGRNPQDDKSTGQRSGSGNKPMHDEGQGGGQGGQKGSEGQGSSGQRR